MVIDIKKGMVFEIKKFAIDDGPGIRTTVFLKGCSLRCWWCHNPEGQRPTPELMYRRSICIRCEECVRSCRQHALKFSSTQMLTNGENCDLCSKCAQKCPTGALQIVGTEMKVKDVVKEIDKDAAFYAESEGGITVSGGEPLLQTDFLNALLRECKKKGVHTAVDTSGYAAWPAVEKIMDKVDLFLYDIKIMDDRMHRKYTGASNKQILDNFKRLAKNGSNIIVRLPVIPNKNDDEDNLASVGKFVLSCNVNQIHLLPYHRSGIEKYRSLRRRYKLNETMTPSNKRMISIKKHLEAFGLDVKVGAT